MKLLLLNVFVLGIVGFSPFTVKAEKIFGDNFDQASKKALQLAKEKKIEFIEAFDDPYTIAGQGTVGKEILDADPSLDVIFVPVGGGGLLRGLAERIERETEVPVRMSNVPLEAVVLGAGHVIEHYEALKGMFMGARR